MTIYDRIKELCRKKEVTITGTEQHLGFARGSLSKINTSKPSMERIQMLADYLGSTPSYIMTGKEKEGDKYYLNDETAEMAQEIFENKELRTLFSAARTASPDDLKTTHDLLLALKRKERGEND